MRHAPAQVQPAAQLSTPQRVHTMPGINISATRAAGRGTGPHSVQRYTKSQSRAVFTRATYKYFAAEDLSDAQLGRKCNPGRRAEREVNYMDLVKACNDWEACVKLRSEISGALGRWKTLAYQLLMQMQQVLPVRGLEGVAPRQRAQVERVLRGTALQAAEHLPSMRTDDMYRLFLLLAELRIREPKTLDAILKVVEIVPHRFLVAQLASFLAAAASLKHSVPPACLKAVVNQSVNALRFCSGEDFINFAYALYATPRSSGKGSLSGEFLTELAASCEFRYSDMGAEGLAFMGAALAKHGAALPDGWLGRWREHLEPQVASMRSPAALAAFLYGTSVWGVTVSVGALEEVTEVLAGPEGGDEAPAPMEALSAPELGLVSAALGACGFKPSTRFVRTWLDCVEARAGTMDGKTATSCIVGIADLGVPFAATSAPSSVDSAGSVAVGAQPPVTATWDLLYELLVASEQALPSLPPQRLANLAATLYGNGSGSSSNDRSSGPSSGNSISDGSAARPGIHQRDGDRFVPDKHFTAALAVAVRRRVPRASSYAQLAALASAFALLPAAATALPSSGAEAGGFAAAVAARARELADGARSAPNARDVAGLRAALARIGGVNIQDLELPASAPQPSTASENQQPAQQAAPVLFQGPPQAASPTALEVPAGASAVAAGASAAEMAAETLRLNPLAPRGALADEMPEAAAAPLAEGPSPAAAPAPAARRRSTSSLSSPPAAASPPPPLAQARGQTANQRPPPPPPQPPRSAAAAAPAFASGDSTAFATGKPGSSTAGRDAGAAVAGEGFASLLGGFDFGSAESLWDGRSSSNGTGSSITGGGLSTGSNSSISRVSSASGSGRNRGSSTRAGSSSGSSRSSPRSAGIARDDGNGVDGYLRGSVGGTPGRAGSKPRSSGSGSSDGSSSDLGGEVGAYGSSSKASLQNLKASSNDNGGHGWDDSSWDPSPKLEWIQAQQPGGFNHQSVSTPGLGLGFNSSELWEWDRDLSPQTQAQGRGAGASHGFVHAPDYRHQHQQHEHGGAFESEDVEHSHSHRKPTRGRPRSSSSKKGSGQQPKRGAWVK